MIYCLVFRHGSLAGMTVKLYAPPGDFYSPIVNLDDVVGLQFADANFASPDISGVTLDSEAMVRLWRGANHTLNSERTPGRHYYFKNEFYSSGDAISL